MPSVCTLPSVRPVLVAPIVALAVFHLSITTPEPPAPAVPTEAPLEVKAPPPPPPPVLAVPALP